MNTQVVDNKMIDKVSLKPFIPIAIGFSIIEMSLLGVLLPKAVMIIGYMIMLKGAYSLVLKDKINSSLTRFVETHSHLFTNVTIFNNTISNHLCISNTVVYVYPEEECSENKREEEFISKQLETNKDTLVKTATSDNINAFLTLIHDLRDQGKMELTDIKHNLINDLLRIPFEKNYQITNQTFLAELISFFIKVREIEPNSINLKYKLFEVLSMNLKDLARHIAQSHTILKQENPYKIIEISFYTILNREMKTSEDLLKAIVNRKETRNTALAEFMEFFLRN